MDTKTHWQKRLNVTIDQLSAQLKIDLYEDVVVPVVQDWFACSDSIKDLNENITYRLHEAWPVSQRKIETAFLDFTTSLKTDIAKVESMSHSAELEMGEAQRQISAAVTNVIGSIGAVFSGTILGGAGTALLLEGPVGWVIGAILGATVFFLGKQTIHNIINSKLHDRKIPALLKKPAKSKVATELKLTGPKFQQELSNNLRAHAMPLYAAIEKLDE